MANTQTYDPFDGALLALLEGEGSSIRTTFLELAIQMEATPGWDVPPDLTTATDWLADAVGRGLIRLDVEDDLISITQVGRGRLIDLL